MALGLGDPVSALTYAQQLHAIPGVPGGLLYLAKLYSAEALVLLERVPEAMQLLNPDSINDISITSMYTVCPSCVVCACIHVHGINMVDFLMIVSVTLGCY